MSATATRQPLTDAAQIVPGRVYGSADVQSLWGVCEWTVRMWVKAGRLKALPRTSKREPLRFLGASLLLLYGDELLALPEPEESPAERDDRAKAAADRINRGRAKHPA